MAAWGANFNFSIWYIEISGVDDQDFVQKTYDDYITVSAFYLFPFVFCVSINEYILLHHPKVPREGNNQIVSQTPETTQLH